MNITRGTTSPVDSAAKGKVSYYKGQRVKCTVDRVYSYGLFVDLEGGHLGYIPIKELSWDGVVNPSALFQPGTQIEAIVLELEPEIRLSYRRALREPWDNFVNSHQVGDVVRGRVARLTEYGAFVELRPGLDALLPKGAITFDQLERVDQVLRPGDVVEGVITQINPTRQWVRISIRERMRQLDRSTFRAILDRHRDDQGYGATISERTGITAEALQDRLGLAEEAGESSAVRQFHSQRPLHVLVIDDEMVVHDSLAEWLRDAECHCESTDSGQEGLIRACKQDWDLVIVDIHLPDLDGITVTREILDQNPEAKIVLMTGRPLGREHLEALETIPVVNLLMKPFDPDDLSAILELARQGELVATHHGYAKSEPLLQEIDFLRQLTGPTLMTQDISQELVSRLALVRDRTGAQVAAVFEMNPETRSAQLLAQDGEVPIRYDSTRHQLGFSPIKDVILEHEFINEGNVRGNAERKFRKLLSLLDFNAFIGVPIAVGSEIRHGLFLFHQDTSHFSWNVFQHALAAAVSLGAVMERKEVETQMQQFHLLSLQGQLAAGLVHDLNNKLAGVLMKADGAADRCSDLERQLRDLTASLTMSQVRSKLDELREIAMGLRETALLFQALMRGDGCTEADANKVLTRAKGVLEPRARKAMVRVELDLASQLPPVSGPAIYLEQAFLNVMTNAIQQIEAHSPQGGTLNIRSTWETSCDRWPVKIHFTDDGPGIHADQFEHIFKLGYTTRPGGTGLGLYMTRSLVEALGGRIEVEESVMLLGSAFRIDLPCAQ